MAVAPAAVPIALVAVGVGGVAVGAAALISGATVATIALVNLMNPYHPEEEDFHSTTEQSDISDIGVYFVQLKFSRSTFLHTAIFLERVTEEGAVKTRYLYEVNGTDAGICEVLHAVLDKVEAVFTKKILIATLADFSWNRFVRQILHRQRLSFYSLFDQNCRHFCLKFLTAIEAEVPACCLSDSMKEVKERLDSTITKDKVARTVLYPLAMALSRSDISKGGVGHNKRLMPIRASESRHILFHYSLRVDSFDPDIPGRCNFPNEGRDKDLVSKFKKSIVKSPVSFSGSSFCDCCQLGICSACPKSLVLQMLHDASCSGILLYGPPGVGKTALINYLSVATADFTVFKITSNIFDNGPSGNVDDSVSLLFDMAACYAPSLIVFDDLEELFSDTRIASALRLRIDICAEKRVVVLASAVHPWNMDTALISRFVPLYIRLPDEAMRLQLFRVFTANEIYSEYEKMDEFIMQLDGYSPRDLDNLCKVAKSTAAIRDSLSISDFESASRVVRPSVYPRMREMYDNWSHDRDLVSMMPQEGFPPPYNQ